jgi:hypothetical protein
LKFENISLLIYSMIYFRHGIDVVSVATGSKNPKNHTRYSAPPLSSQTKDRFRSPFLSTTPASTEQNGTNGNHSEEYESPEKV